MRYFILIIIFISSGLLSACLPGAADEADFYDLCAKHNRRYANGETLILQYHEARQHSDYHFWRGDHRASVTVIVWVWTNDAQGAPRNTGYGLRRCEFRETGKGWRLV